MSKILVISGHPNLKQSHANQIILAQLQTGLKDVEIRHLAELYPNYQINVAEEQKALLVAEVIVLQFPFYWYSMPALLKKWIDDVFSYNFAYGARGDKLKGKDFVLSFTVGGPQESYAPLGYNHFTVEQMIRPLEQTVYLTGMKYHPPVYTNGMIYIPGVYNRLEDVQAKAMAHSERLLAQIRHICASPENRIAKFTTEWFSRFDRLEEDASFFLQHLSDQIVWSMPEGNFLNHQGFLDWYALVRKQFKPGCQHTIEQLEVQPHGDGYEVSLRVRLLAQTYENSSFKGAVLNVLINETWQLTLDEGGKITIHTYRGQAVTES